MDKFMSYVIIIAIIALVVFICYRIVKSEKPTPTRPEQTGGKPRNTDHTRNVHKEQFSDPYPDQTDPLPTGGRDNGSDTVPVLSEEWLVAELDFRSGRVLQTAVVSDGCIIGRQSDCDFVLRTAGKDVSRHHLRVERDSSGYYASPLIKDGYATTFIGQKQVTREFPLEEGQIVWLSKTPVVFMRCDSRLPKRFDVDSDRPRLIFGGTRRSNGN
jgi:hypothetical protein